LETIALKEYEDHIVELSEPDAEFIEEDLSGKVSIRRELRGQSYVLNPNQFVGVVPLPSGKLLESQPKIPVRNLFYMLAVAFQLPPFRPEVAMLERLDQILEFVANFFAELVEERIGNGLYRWYVEREDDLSAIRGKINIIEDLRRNHIIRQRTYCRFDEFTWDISENQIVRQVSQLLSGWQFLPQTRFRLGQIDRRLDEVTRTHFSAIDVAKIHYHRLNEDYRPIHQLCRLFLEGASLSEEAGVFSFRAFLIDMNKLFEKFVCQILAARCSGNLRIDFQKHIYLDRAEIILMKPDILIRRANTFLVAADCKYKRVENEDSATQDIYQLLAYCTATNTQRGLLIYPLHLRGAMEKFSILHTGTCVQQISIDLMTDLERLPQSCNSFAERVFGSAQN
jgi:5-methylcytosine-specific restriction enzyme subunit McrC